MYMYITCTLYNILYIRVLGVFGMFIGQGYGTGPEMWVGFAIAGHRCAHFLLI